MANLDPAEPRDLVSLLRTGDSPLELRQFAARGLLPLDGDDQMRALLAVANDPDADTADAARERLAAIPHDEVSRFLRQGAPTGMELDVVARRSEDHLVLEQIIRNRNVADETLELLAHTVTGAPQDALVVNQARLLKRPGIIDALFANPNLTADNRRRLKENREEFFGKEQRRKEAERLRKEEEAAAAAAAPAELTAEEQAEVDAAQAEEGPGSLTEEEFKQLLTQGAIHRKIATMTVSEKIKLAYAGGREERRILIGDSNRLVGAAVLKSRGITLSEVEAICTMRHLDDEIFRLVSGHNEWLRKPSIVLAMVRNPKVPLALALPLIKNVSQRDLRLIARDPSLADGLRIMARKLMVERRG
ncbi:MAG: hypothetical protein ACRD00_07355 [Thermoanaerobaculia bacterium]